MKQKLYVDLKIVFFCTLLQSTMVIKALEEPRFCIVEPEGFFIKKMLYDALYLHLNFISIDTLKLCFIGAPAYIIGRSIDESVSSCFYCKNEHKNRYQLPSSYHKAADEAARVISLGLSSLAILPGISDDVRLTARVFAAGLVPLWGVKNIIKGVHHHGCIRPKCEFFDKNKTYYRGCPSGHMAFMSYGLTLFSLQHGYQWGIPLGAATLGIFASGLNSNRHYVSQLIAGIGLGMLYGIGAYKVVNAYKQTTLECSLVAERGGLPALEIAHSF